MSTQMILGTTDAALHNLACRMISWMSTTSKAKTAAFAKVLTLAVALAFALAFEVDIKGLTNVRVCRSRNRVNDIRTQLPAALATLLPNKASKATNRLLCEASESLLGMPITKGKLLSNLIWRKVCEVGKSVDLIPVVRASVRVGPTVIVVSNLLLSWLLLLLLISRNLRNG